MKHKHGNRWHPETCAPRKQIRALYLSGLSTREVGKKVQYSYAYISRICKDIARSRIEAVRLACPAWSKSLRASRAQARRVLEQHLKRRLKSSEHVHHKDGDITNNAVENLRIMTQRDHNHIHPRERDAAGRFS